MKPASIDQVTALHGILYILIEEYEKFKDPLAMQYDLQSYSAQCQRIFNTGIETYDILAVPSFESVLALTLAVRRLLVSYFSVTNSKEPLTL